MRLIPALTSTKQWATGTRPSPITVMLSLWTPPSKKVRTASSGSVSRPDCDGYQIVQTFYDAAVSGADRIDQREGFTDLLAYIRSNGAKTILIENATRFARDLTVQLTGHDLLKAEGFDLIPVDAPTYFTEDNPTAELVRQVLGAISQFDKVRLVMKLKSARDRKSAKQGKRIEGRKPYQETRPELVKAAKSLAHGNRKERLSLRAVSARLAEQVKRLLAA